MSPKYQRIISDLRYAANDDEIITNYRLAMDDAADIIEETSALCDAIDRTAELNPEVDWVPAKFMNDIRAKREALR